MGKKNIGFIGCGKISHFHADVLKSLGHSITAVSSRKDSKTISGFAEKYNVPAKYDNWKSMVENENVDCLWVTASWDVIDKLLLDLVQVDIPIFIEKPIALGSQKIKQAIETAKTRKNKIQIGYNRRFYNFVPALKEVIANNNLRTVSIEIPESTNNKNDELIKYLWIQNSSHVLDLAYLMLGELTIEKVFKSKKPGHNYFDTFNALLTARNNIPVHLIANWNTPANFSITFYFDEFIVKLSPLEIAKFYKGFEIIEPDEKTPIRQYNPKLEKELLCTGQEDKFKPGFLQQTNYFFDNSTKDGYKAAELSDALYITRLIEDILT